MKALEIFELIKDDPAKVIEFMAEVDEYATPDLIKGLEEIAIGDHFTSDRLIEAYAGMKNKDGTAGAHWTLEKTMSGASEIGFDYKALGYNDFDWDFTVNMVYSDFYKPTRTVEEYLELAIDYLSDIDVQDGKIYKYYDRVIKNNCD
jgi:hypothetical protein